MLSFVRLCVELRYYSINNIFCENSRKIKATIHFTVMVNDSTAGRRDSFKLLQSVLMNVIGLYVSCKFGGNVKLVM